MTYYAFMGSEVTKRRGFPFLKREAKVPLAGRKFYGGQGEG